MSFDGTKLFKNYDFNNTSFNNVVNTLLLYLFTNKFNTKI